jgi:hypothetical protein
MKNHVSAGQRSPTSIVEAAIDAFNRGHVSALLLDEKPGRGRRQVSPDAAAVAIDERPISVAHVSALDDRRVFCALVTAHGNELVGVYALVDGRIAQARHYFSDFATLVSVGVLGQDDGKSSTEALSSR